MVLLRKKLWVCWEDSLRLQQSQASVTLIPVWRPILPTISYTSSELEIERITKISIQTILRPDFLSFIQQDDSSVFYRSSRLQKSREIHRKAKWGFAFIHGPRNFAIFLLWNFACLWNVPNMFDLMEYTQKTAAQGLFIVMGWMMSPENPYVAVLTSQYLRIWLYLETGPLQS